MIQRLVILVLSLTFSFSVTPSALAADQPTLACPVLRPIAQGFLANHVTARALDTEHENRTIEQFIKRLDPSKIYLLESDVAQIRGNLKGVFKKLGEDCTGIEKSHQILVQRMNEALDYAKKTLGEGFKFQESTDLVIDPNLRVYAKTKAESDAQMQKFIQFQISNYLASDMKLPQARTQLIHRYEINAKRQAEFSRDDLYSTFLSAFASSLDAHSDYLSADTLEDFEIQMRLSLQGIGAALTWEDGYTTVENLIPGGSAEKSGELQPKDKIIAVAQGDKPFEQVIDLPLRDVVKLIRGKKGTTVRLTVLREGTKETSRHIISLKRDNIKLEDEAAQVRYTTRKAGGRDYKIAIIDLPSFYGDLTKRTRSSFEDMKKALEKIRKDKADAVVLDLSKNGGGLLTEAVRIAGLFIDKGNVVATQDTREKLDLLADEEDGVVYNGPLVVLTSRLSASASEIVAGALQDYRRAIVVGGDHTFGKGTVQAMINLPPELGAIKVTTGMFFIPGGQSTQHRGVPADIALPSPFSTKDIGEGSLDYPLPSRAVDAFVSTEANKPGPNHWMPVDAEVIKKLKTASAARVEKDPEFKKIVQELAEQEKKKGVIKLSDSLKKQKEENKDGKKKSARARRGQRQTDEEYLKTPHVNEVLNITTEFLQASAAPQQAAR